MLTIDTRDSGTDTPVRRLYRRAASAVTVDPRTLSIGIYGACALFALVYGTAITSLDPHKLWAFFAFAGYTCAAVIAFRGGSRHRSLVAASLGAIALPGLVATALGIFQPEVQVIRESASRLLTTGSPYLAHPEQMYDYNPYSPAMTLFGVPSHLDPIGIPVLTDPRVWMLGSFLLCVVLALRLTAHLTPRAVGVLGPVIVSPLVAMSAVTSAVDLPMIGLTVLAFALLVTERRGASAVVLGLALALKWTVAPILLVAVVAVVRRHDLRRGIVFAAASISTAAALILAPAAGNLSALVENTVLFPAGRGEIITPAGKSIIGGPLEAVSGSSALTYAVLVLVGAVMIGVVLRRRVWDLSALCTVTAAGLTALFLVAPASRPGYFAFPLVLLAVAAVAARSTGATASENVGFAPAASGL